MAGSGGMLVRTDSAQAAASATGDALEHYPALADAKQRAGSLLAAGDGRAAGAVIGSDVGLALAVLREANDGAGAEAAGVREAADRLGEARLALLVRDLPVLDFFQRAGSEATAVRFAFHAAAVQRVAAVLGRRIGFERPDELLTAALLHDVGQLVLTGAAPGYPREVHGDARTPEERLAAERRRLRTDHAAAGATLVRAWGFPQVLVEAIGLHHDESCQGLPAIVRLADLLAHYQHGEPVGPIEVQKAALALGLGRDAVGALLYDLAYPLEGDASQQICPLTARELDVVRGLAEGKVYKQVASDLEVSVSTVRNHAHNAYRKLDVVDRAQAVMLASERGWL
ncbi:MAG: HDOD domain-containing protein [Thermoleophilaceae bacterium]